MKYEKMSVIQKRWLPVMAIMASLTIIALVYINGGLKPPAAIRGGDTPDEVTPEQIAEYRETIGNDLSVKRGLIIIFNSAEACAEFIDTHGSSEDILELGMGIVPVLEQDQEGDYYNMSGNAVFEPIFDSLADGEHYREPVMFGEMFCYVKRLNVKLPDDAALKQMIEQVKQSQQTK